MTPPGTDAGGDAGVDGAPTLAAVPSAAGAHTAEADLTEVLAHVAEKLEADVVTVLGVDPAADHLVTLFTVSTPPVTSGHHRVPIGQGLAGRVAAQRVTIAREDLTDDDLINPALLPLGITSAVAMPLVRGRRLLGVLKAGTRRRRRFSPEDLDRAEVLAGDVSEAVDAYVAASERSAAAALQRSLVPHTLPALAGLQMAGRYVPGRGGVSGDWYDVFELPGGRVGMVMGDVAGHGLAASVVMGRLRSALRAYALEYDDPAVVLSRLDAKIHHFEPGAMATAVYAVAEPPFDTVRIASAGHLLPIGMGADDRTAQVDVPVSPPLGVDPTCRRTSAEVDFAGPAALVLFTDGLVERRATSTSRAAEVFGSIDAALGELCSLVGPEDAEVVCGRIVDTMLTLEPPGDDVAVLVVRRLAD
ncbi:MAG TPA: GAF domain-containing SpoIIE family protein phosphatase [Marmoricola sp.]|nr:GAF domain-containing SpoIIE family protein phosphatase [Marmoricola sp.]